MTENVILFFFGQAIVLISAGIISHISNSNRISKLEGFIEGLGVEFAQRLHHTDDRYGVDALLDKYIDRHYELSPLEWVDLYDACIRILALPSLTPLEETGYLFIKRVCLHKAEQLIKERDAMKGKIT